VTKGAEVDKAVQKNVTAWLDLRNKAAHGKYAEYQGEQVSLLLAAVSRVMQNSPDDPVSSGLSQRRV
jgi:hypothetical protein